MAKVDKTERRRKQSSSTHIQKIVTRKLRTEFVEKGRQKETWGSVKVEVWRFKALNSKNGKIYGQGLALTRRSPASSSARLPD